MHLTLHLAPLLQSCSTTLKWTKRLRHPRVIHFIVNQMFHRTSDATIIKEDWSSNYKTETFAFFIVKDQAFHTLDKKLIFARNKTIIIKFRGKKLYIVDNVICEHVLCKRFINTLVNLNISTLSKSQHISGNQQVRPKLQSILRS